MEDIEDALGKPDIVEVPDGPGLQEFDSEPADLTDDPDAYFPTIYVKDAAASCKKFCDGYKITLPTAPTPGRMEALGRKMKRGRRRILGQFGGENSGGQAYHVMSRTVGGEIVVSDIERATSRLDPTQFP